MEGQLTLLDRARGVVGRAGLVAMAVCVCTNRIGSRFSGPPSSATSIASLLNHCRMSRIRADTIDGGAVLSEDQSVDESPEQRGYSYTCNVGGRVGTNRTFDKTRSIMSDHPVQQLWKWELVSGVLTIILGAIVLAWPGPSILVASTLFAVYLLVAPRNHCAVPMEGSRHIRFR